MTIRQLPEPVRERWQPLRTGLVDLFYYDVEEFWFRDGRLLLRGNNGTGKSKVLALTLPFLLDGSLAARRVEPDGDPHKRMEWNLLLGGAHPNPERLGYTWIEFGRRAADGSTEFRTLGCGLKAVKGKGIARHWFFSTAQRVGADPAEGGLLLLDSTGTALGRDRLGEALEGYGLVYDHARDYRRAVDEALFGLGEDRYKALVDLLVNLRQPQLSKRPSEKALSSALSEALAPVDQGVIADVAEAFKSLDEERDALAAMAEARDAAAGFLRHYERYAGMAARRRARPPRTLHARYEDLRRDLSAAETARDAAGVAIDDADRRLAEAEDARRRLRTRDETLRSGPEMRSARELEIAAARRDETAAQARAVGEDRDRAAGAAARADRRLAAADGRADAARRAVGEAVELASGCADAAGFGADHRARVVAPLAVPTTVPEVSADFVGAASGTEELRRVGQQLADRQGQAADYVAKRVGTAAETAAGAAAAGRLADDAEDDLQRVGEQRGLARTRVGDAADTLVREFRTYADRLAVLPLHAEVAVEGLLDDLAAWAESMDGPSPARGAVARASRAEESALAVLDAAVAAERDAAERERGELEGELAALQAGGQRGPDAPYTRSAHAREGVPGAPLWRVVDFVRSEAPRGDSAGRGVGGAPSAAGLEAALEAAGLLDAWIAPDGPVLSANRHDVLLRPGRPVAGTSLADVLRPAVDHADPAAAALGDDRIRAVLAAIGVYPRGADAAADVSAWVAWDGSFRIGPLSGAWQKPDAQYLGEGAREAARRARITAVRARLAELEAVAAGIAERVSALGARRTALAAELAAFPDRSEEELRTAHARLGAVEAAAAEAARRVEVRRGEARLAAEAADAAQEALLEAAADTGLPADLDGLAGVRAAVASYREALAALWPAVRERAAAARAAAEERGEAEAAAEQAAELAERAADAAGAAADAVERHTTLAATVGAAVAELQDRLRQVVRDLARCEQDERAARSDHTKAVNDRGVAQGRYDQLRSEIASVADSRAEAIEDLRRFTATGLLAVALPELDVAPPQGDTWAPEPAVRLARRIENELAAVDDGDPAWERVQNKTSEELKNLQDALARHGHSAVGRPLDLGLVVDIVFQGREHAVPELIRALGTEVAERQRMLSAREREVLETHLITEVAGTLHELVAAAEGSVEHMNDELRHRPTSTGMLLRLRWRPAKDAPPELARARERLRQTADAWTEDDRAAVGAFLQTQIERARAADPAATWTEHLTTALDYRTWHEFAVERHQHGQWVSATGPASGGERVLAASVPLFAAASAHYASAGNPHAPRMVMLDEAFAGVDDDSRAKCLGLLAAFDLDVVMTSEREWGCYPEVPGLSIAQLSRTDELDVVLVTRWEWDGHDKSYGTEPDAWRHAKPAARVTAPRSGLTDPTNAGEPAEPEGLFP
ncbi:TIGR02680 family protein [Streptomycetaceae bacterium NBC_01309]